MTSVYDKGVAGENFALAYLSAKDFRLLKTRYRSRYGEIDLIMMDQGILVFVEVKYRKKGKRGDGFIAVTLNKQIRMRNTAAWYASENGLTDAIMRFDVVEITRQGIAHIENAF